MRKSALAQLGEGLQWRFNAQIVTPHQALLRCAHARIKRRYPLPEGEGFFADKFLSLKEKGLWFVMGNILMIFIFTLSLAACGKKPKTLELPEGLKSEYPRTYPDPKDLDNNY